MKIQKKLKSLLAVLLALVLTAALIGCATKTETSQEDVEKTTEESAAAEESGETEELEETEEPTEDNDSEKSEEPEDIEVRTFQIATEGAYAPFNYLDENGNPDGYDIAVAKAVDDLIPEVQFEYQAVEWSSIFAGLEAERYDLIVSQAAKTPEREEKYLFSDTPYTWSIGAIAYKTGRTDITSMDDLAGKTVTVAVGSSNASVIETWNEAHGNVINVTYGDGDITKALLDVQEGRVDATLVSPITAGYLVQEQGLDIEFVLRNDDTTSATYWLFTQTEDGEYLKGLVDEALQTLIENGKLAELSKEYLGDDYSTQEAVEARVG